MITHENHIEITWSVQKQKPPTQTRAAFKQMFSKFSDSQSAMNMRLAEGLGQIAKREQTLGSLHARKPGEGVEHIGPNRQRLFHF